MNVTVITATSVWLIGRVKMMVDIKLRLTVSNTEEKPSVTVQDFFFFFT